MKFNDLYKLMTENISNEHLSLKQVEKVFDDVLHMLGLYIHVRGPVVGDTPITTPGYLESKMDDIARETVRAFKAGIHPKYRSSLNTDGYDLLVRIADENNLWVVGDAENEVRGKNIAGSRYHRTELDTGDGGY